VEIEKKWPEKVQQDYGRKRSGHDKTLKAYRFFIGAEDNPECEECGEGPEDIEHVLCKCPSLEARRRSYRHDGAFTIADLVDDPDTCRKVLAARFPELRIDTKETQSTDDVLQPFGLQGGNGLQSLE